jgi:hypothetical protein
MVSVPMWMGVSRIRVNLRPNSSTELFCANCRHPGASSPGQRDETSQGRGARWKSPLHGDACQCEVGHEALAAAAGPGRTTPPAAADESRCPLRPDFCPSPAGCCPTRASGSIAVSRATSGPGRAVEMRRASAAACSFSPGWARSARSERSRPRACCRALAGCRPTLSSKPWARLPNWLVFSMTRSTASRKEGRRPSSPSAQPCRQTDAAAASANAATAAALRWLEPVGLESTSSRPDSSTLSKRASRAITGSKQRAPGNRWPWLDGCGR